MERVDDAAPGAVYILCSGWLQKRGGFVKGWKRRYFVLRNDRFLCYFSQEIGAESSLETIQRAMLGMISLSDALAVGDSTDTPEEDEMTFDIVTPGRTYVCQARSLEAKNKWIEALRAMITPITDFAFSKQGYLYKKSKYKWTRHYFALGRHCVFLFDDERNAQAFQRIASHSGKVFSLAMERYCHSAISLHNAQVQAAAPAEDIDGMFNTFSIEAAGRKTWLSALSPKEVKRWVDEIGTEILTRQNY